MIFLGKKLNKKDYTERLAKRLAMKARVKHGQRHLDRAAKMVADGCYDEYCNTFKKTKSVDKSSVESK